MSPGGRRRSPTPSASSDGGGEDCACEEDGVIDDGGSGAAGLGDANVVVGDGLEADKKDADRTGVDPPTSKLTIPLDLSGPLLASPSSSGVGAVAPDGAAAAATAPVTAWALGTGAFVGWTESLTHAKGASVLESNAQRAPIPKTEITWGELKVESWEGGDAVRVQSAYVRMC